MKNLFSHIPEKNRILADYYRLEAENTSILTENKPFILRLCPENFFQLSLLLEPIAPEYEIPDFPLLPLNNILDRWFDYVNRILLATKEKKIRVEYCNPDLIKILNLIQTHHNQSSEKDTLRALGVLCDAVFIGPKRLLFDPNTSCNIQCMYCRLHSPLRDKVRDDYLKSRGWTLDTKFSFPVFEKTIKDAADCGVEQICLVGSGEPTMHPEFKSMVECVKQHSLILNFSTNGMNLTEDLNQTLVDCDVNRITISLSGSSPRTYKIIHPKQDKDCFEKICSQIRDLNLRKEERRNQDPSACMKTDVLHVIHAFNYKDILKMVLQAKEMKADRIWFQLLHVSDFNRYLRLRPHQKNEVKFLLMEAKQLAASLGLEIADYMDLQLEHVHSDGTWSKNIFEDYGCLVGWFFSYLNVAAEASFCCGNKILGDLNETNFKDLWQSPDYALFRNKARAFDWDDNLKARNETMLLDEFCHNCDNHNFNMEMVDILKKLQLLPFVQKKRKKHLPKSALKKHIKKENTKASKGWYFNVSLTDSCQFRCQFCDTWKNPLNIKTELTAAQWIKVFENTKSLFEGTRINFSGGEPLLKKNFHHLLRWLSLSGQKTSVSTNAGSFTRQKAYEIATSGLGILGISLDGLETTHDTLRGTPGAYTKVRQTIEWIREWNSEMEINILTIILKENLEDIKKLVQWVETDPMVTHIHFQALSVLGKSESKWWDSHPLWPDNKEVEELLDFLISHRKKEEAENIFPKTISNIIPQLESMKKYFENPQTKSETPCGIHESGITLSPQGELLFCPFMKSTGSAFLNKAETLITSSEAEALKQRIINCPEHHCHLRVNCCFESD